MFSVGRLMKSLMMVGVVVGLVACGKTDPMEDHKDLKTVPYQIKTYQPVTPAKALHQEYDPSGFRLEVLGQSQTNYANFTEGQTGTVRIKIYADPAITQFALSSTDLPDSAKLSPTNDPTVWALTWTPPAGTVPPTGLPRTWVVHVIAGVIKSDPRFSAQVSDPLALPLNITRAGGAPQISGFTGFKGAINEGESFNFSVEVADPSSAPPTVFVTPYNSGKNVEETFGDGAPYIHAATSNPIEGSAGHWKLNFIMSLEGSRLTPQLVGVKDANHVQLCATFRVFNSFNVPADPKPKCTRVGLMVQSPEITFNESPLQAIPIVVKEGTTATITVSGAIENRRGVADLRLAKSSNLENWPGKPTWDCKAGRDVSEQICTVTWQVPCGIKQTKFSLVVNSTNKQGAEGNKLKSMSDFRDVIVTKSEACTPAPAAVSPASTVKKHRVVRGQPAPTSDTYSANSVNDQLKRQLAHFTQAAPGGSK